MAPKPPADGETLVRHVHSAQADIVYCADVPAKVMKSGSLGFGQGDEMMIAAVYTVHESDTIAGAI